MTAPYHLKNIRTLLTKGLSCDELRQLCYDEPLFRPVYEQLALNVGSDKIVSLLIEYAERRELLEYLLSLVKKINPAKYRKYEPYVISPPVQIFTILHNKRISRSTWVGILILPVLAVLCGITLGVAVSEIYVSVTPTSVLTQTATPMPSSTSTPKVMMPFEYIGKVLDSDNNLYPIPNAEVALEIIGIPIRTYTDSKGIYKFSLSVNVVRQTARVWVTARDYETFNQLVNILSENRLDDIRLKRLPTSTPSPTPTNTPDFSTPTPTSTPTPEITVGYAEWRGPGLWHCDAILANDERKPQVPTVVGLVTDFNSVRGQQTIQYMSESTFSFNLSANQELRVNDIYVEVADYEPVVKVENCVSYYFSPHEITVFSTWINSPDIAKTNKFPAALEKDGIPVAIWLDPEKPEELFLRFVTPTQGWYRLKCCEIKWGNEGNALPPINSGTEVLFVTQELVQ